MSKILASILLVVGIAGASGAPALASTKEDTQVAITGSCIAFNHYMDMNNTSDKSFTPQELVDIFILNDFEDMAIDEQGVNEEDLYDTEYITRKTRFMWRE